MIPFLLIVFVAFIVSLVLRAHWLLFHNGRQPQRKHKPSRRMQFDDGSHAHPRLLCQLADANKVLAGQTTVEQLARVIKAEHRAYGPVELSLKTFRSFIKNFEDGAYGQGIFVDLEHNPSGGALGEFKRLFIEGDALLAEIQWNEGSAAAVKRHPYFSIDFEENYTNSETGKKFGPVIFGAGLVTRPFIKSMRRVGGPQLNDGSADNTATDETRSTPGLRLALSEHGPLLVPNHLSKTFDEAQQAMFKRFRDQLQKLLNDGNITQAVMAAMLSAYDGAAKNLGEDESAYADLIKQLSDSAITLKESGSAETPSINITLAESKQTVDVDAAVAKALSDRETKQTADAKQLSDAVAGRNKQFAELINASTLADADKQAILAANQQFMDAPLSVTQIKALAEQQIATATQLSASTQLANMGYGVDSRGGSTRLSVDDSNAVKRLADNLDKRFGLTDDKDPARFGELKQLQPKNKEFADKVLALFDAQNGHALHEESKRFDAGQGITSDVDVPKSFMRTMIRESLYSLVGLQTVATKPVEFSNSINIPYSFRDTSAAGINDVRVYENGGIGRSGVVQTTEETRLIPQKLAFLFSGELAKLTRDSIYDWDIQRENVANAARIIGEDLERNIFNEHQRAGDEYNAYVMPAPETVPAADVDGTNAVFVFEQYSQANPALRIPHYPVVPPRLQYNLKGEIKETFNLPVINYDGNEVFSFPGGTGNPNAVYYRLNYNMGEVSFADGDGNLIVPPNGTAITFQCSIATNVSRFDTDKPENVRDEDFWNRALTRIGDRKEAIISDRYYNPTTMVMSGHLRNNLEKAGKYEAQHRIPGTELAANGNLGMIKDLPTFRSTAPGLLMGDQRLIMTQAGVTKFGIADPWSMEPLENARNAAGRFIDNKETFGTQHFMLYTPTELRAAISSVVFYSALARVSRAS